MSSLLRTANVAVRPSAQESQSRARSHVLAALVQRVANLLALHVGIVQTLISTTLFLSVSVKSVGVSQNTVHPVRLSCQVGFQVSFLFPVIRLFGWILLPVGGRVVPNLVLVTIICWKILFSPRLLRVAALAASPGPRTTRRLVCVRGRCSMSHQRS